MKYSLLLFCTLVCLSVTSVAQETVTRGQITMTLLDVDTEDEDMSQHAQLMTGSKSIVSFNEKYSSMELNMMEGMISMKTITNLEQGDSQMYVDAMGMKYVIPISKEERNEMIKKNAGDGDFQITYDKAETKVIAGYTCYKATVTHPDNADTMITCYVTEEIKADPKVLQGFEQIDLVGFPLEYTIGSSEMGVTFTTQEFSKGVDDSVFEFDAKGYQKMSFEEFSKMGGMGF